MHTYEVEIKVLLGPVSEADTFRTRLATFDPNTKLVGTESQKNHYFMSGSAAALPAVFGGFLSAEQMTRLQDIAARAKNASVRTRYTNGVGILVVKATVDDTTSQNGTARIEFEATFLPDTFGIASHDESALIQYLDELVLSAGFAYQAKWSRARETFALSDGITTVCLDKNAGYGYVVEFERVVDSADATETAKANLRSIITSLGYQELAQDRLERMFAHYNTAWAEYYGTDKTFSLE